MACCDIVQLVATLVAEIILCCKEVNTKTRAAAYELLIDIAHAMHAARPPPDTIPEGDTMGACHLFPGVEARTHQIMAVLRSLYRKGI